jgi:hypothetical protein
MASGAWVSKVDHRATAEHVLRPGEALRMRAGSGDAGSARGSSGGGGATWKKQRRPARGRGRRQRGKGGRVEGLRAALGRRGRGTWPVERRRRAGRAAKEGERER